MADRQSVAEVILGIGDSHTVGGEFRSSDAWDMDGVVGMFGTIRVGKEEDNGVIQPMAADTPSFCAARAMRT